MEMCDSSQLQIDLFVTNDTPRRSKRRPSAQPLAANFDSTDELAPPTAPFARQARGGSPSRDSVVSEMSDWSDAEESPSHSRQFSQMPGYGDHVDSVTDLVLFEGEEEERTPAELEVSSKLKKEGKLRRAISRRGGKGSMKRPAVNSTAPPPTNHSTQRLYDQQQPQDSFEALPLDHHDSSPSLHDSPYAPRSASFGDIGYRHSPSLSYDDRSVLDDSLEVLRTTRVSAISMELPLHLHPTPIVHSSWTSQRRNKTTSMSLQNSLVQVILASSRFSTTKLTDRPARLWLPVRYPSLYRLSTVLSHVSRAVSCRSLPFSYHGNQKIGRTGLFRPGGDTERLVGTVGSSKA